MKELINQKVILETQNWEEQKDIDAKIDKISTDEIVSSSPFKSGVSNFCCKQCNKVLSSKYLLSTHLKVDHQKLFKCKDCDLEFKQGSQLESHIIKAHSVKMKHKCEICEKQYCVQMEIDETHG